MAASEPSLGWRTRHCRSRDASRHCLRVLDNRAAQSRGAGGFFRTLPRRLSTARAYRASQDHRSLSLSMSPYRLSACGPALRSRQAKLARSVGESPTQVMLSRQPGSECCVSRRRRRPRSVHSGCVGCVIEPRNGSSQERRPCSRSHVRICAGGGEKSPSLPRPSWAVHQVAAILGTPDVLPT